MSRGRQRKQKRHWRTRTLFDPRLPIRTSEGKGCDEWLMSVLPFSLTPPGWEYRSLHVIVKRLEAAG